MPNTQGSSHSGKFLGYSLVCPTASIWTENQAIKATSKFKGRICPKLSLIYVGCHPQKRRRFGVGSLLYFNILFKRRAGNLSFQAHSNAYAINLHWHCIEDF